MVPEGHTVQVHPPGAVPQPALEQPGMIPQPMNAGAQQAMSAALPLPNEQKKAPAAKEQPARKKKPDEKGSKLKEEGTEGTSGKEKTPR
jgi:hypothetical protein